MLWFTAGLNVDKTRTRFRWREMVARTVAVAVAAVVAVVEGRIPTATEIALPRAEPHVILPLAWPALGGARIRVEKLAR